jgi:hypothetical protein
MVIDQSGIVRYRGAGVDVSAITSWIDDLLLTGLEDKSKAPSSPALYQNFPNPFNPATNIRFEINESHKVTLKIFDNSGRLITTLIDNVMNPGGHEISWNGLDYKGQPVASGVYYYKLTAGDFKSAKRMILMR